MTLFASKMPEYGSWSEMKRRCQSPKHVGWRNYGGRGIRVHPAWAASFWQFLQDVGPRPGPGYSIDRIDNNGHYEPGNVRWATTNQQHNNTRFNRLVTYDGQTHTVTEWSALVGVSAHRMLWRLNHGWPAERILDARSFERTKRITFGVETRTLVEWASVIGINYHVVSDRLEKGWPLEKVLDPQLERGRYARVVGKPNGRRFTNEQVRQIRTDRTNGRPVRVIAQQLNVSQETIYAIVNRTTYADVD